VARAHRWSADFNVCAIVFATAAVSDARTAPRRPSGLIALVDDHSRLAYSEVLPDEQGVTCARFLRRAGDFFAAHGIRFQRLMTDNAFAYRLSHAFQATLLELGMRHLRTPARRPQPNGKVERFNRTLLEEWAYVRPYASNAERVGLLAQWLHLYNYHRAHTALGGVAPIQRVNNLYGNYI